VIIYVFGENFKLINPLFPQNSNKFHPDVEIIKWVLKKNLNGY
jgi:hypothetical protein